MITAVIEFFALGTIGFYALLFVVALIVTILEENEKGIWATITVLGTIGVLQWGIHIHILQGIIKSPGWDLAYCAGYLVIGIVWSYIKWISLVARALDDVGVLERDFVRAVAKAQLDNPQVVAQAIAEVGTMADAQLTDEPVTA